MDAVTSASLPAVVSRPITTTAGRPQSNPSNRQFGMDFTCANQPTASTSGWAGLASGRGHEQISQPLTHMSLAMSPGSSIRLQVEVVDSPLRGSPGAHTSGRSIGWDPERTAWFRQHVLVKQWTMALRDGKKFGDFPGRLNEWSAMAHIPLGSGEGEDKFTGMAALALSALELLPKDVRLAALEDMLTEQSGVFIPLIKSDWRLGSRYDMFADSEQWRVGQLLREHGII